MASIASLRTKWAAFCESCKRFGSHIDGAKVAEEVLADLDALEHAPSSETVSLGEAVSLTGYSSRTLSRMIRDKRLTNHGTPKRPRVVLAELPKKAAVRPAAAAVRLVTPGNAAAVDAIARDAVASRRGRVRSA